MLQPDRWDYYWHIKPCDFVMQRLERKDDKIFGTPRLTEAWRNAVLSNPLAYLKHRLTFMRTFLAEPFWCCRCSSSIRPIAASTRRIRSSWR